MNFPLETSLFWGPLLPVKHGWICKLSSEANISEAKIIGFEDSKPEPRSLFFPWNEPPSYWGIPHDYGNPKKYQHGLQNHRCWKSLLVYFSRIHHESRITGEGLPCIWVGPNKIKKNPFPMAMIENPINIRKITIKIPIKILKSIRNIILPVRMANHFGWLTPFWGHDGAPGL